MSFKKNVLEKLKNIEDKLGRLYLIINNDRSVMKQNQDLFDRLMSIKWEEYAIRSPEIFNRIEESKGTSNPVDPLSDENLIGEIIADEELGK